MFPDGQSTELEDVLRWDVSAVQAQPRPMALSPLLTRFFGFSLPHLISG